MNKKGLLLLNLGTPDAPGVFSVARYLRTFLMDRRVIELPYLFRWLLVHGIVLPFRSPNSAKMYQEVWQEAGSPLLLNSQAFADAIAARLGPDYTVSLGMRYRNPSIKQACEQLMDAGCEHITVFPLFPQYSSAATGSALEEAYRFFGKLDEIPAVRMINEFHLAPFYIKTLAHHIEQHIQQIEFDCLLMSYHGLPAKFKAYRQQCENTSHQLAKQLALPQGRYAFSFQSRLGRLEWLKPYTEDILSDLRAKGVEKLAMVCPSFVADCLETLEEINMGIRETWMSLGGTSFHYIPCLNQSPAWVDACANMLQDNRQCAVCVK